MFEVNDLQETLPCANAQLIPAIHYNYSNHTATIPILLMSPASAMTVCVTLQATPLLNGTASYYLYSHAHILNFSFEIRHNIPCTLAPPPGTTCFLGVVSHPLSPPPHLVTFLSILIFRTSPILYQITALGNSTGFYEQALPTATCGTTTPLVVGYKPSQVNVTDFFGYPTPLLCQASPFKISRTMISGFSNTILLNFLCRQCKTPSQKTEFKAVGETQIHGQHHNLLSQVETIRE